MLAFAAPLLISLTTKLLRGEAGYSDLDDDARYLGAALFLGYFMYQRINLARLLEFTLPLALLATLAVILVDPQTTARWGGRYATSFVDPNALGSYATILGFMTLMSVRSFRLPSFTVLSTLKILGLAAALWLTLLAASRGGWLAMPVLLLLWAVFRWSELRWKTPLLVALIASLVAGGLLLLPGLAARATAPVSDVATWVNDSNKATAPGQRLSIWKYSLTLIAEKPLTGWGIPGYNIEVSRPETIARWQDEIIFSPTGGYGGAHNDALQMMIVSGIAGLIAYLLLLLVPLLFFLRHHGSTAKDVRLACELGACLVLGVMVCGLTNEMLSLKYLASFYSLTVSALAAQVLLQKHSPFSESSIAA